MLPPMDIWLNIHLSATHLRHAMSDTDIDVAKSIMMSFLVFFFPFNVKHNKDTTKNERHAVEDGWDMVEIEATVSP